MSLEIDPWLGTWKLDKEKSKGLTPDVLNVAGTITKREAAGPNTYRVTSYRANTSEPTALTVIWDGKDHDSEREGDKKGEFTRSVQRVDNSHIRTTFKKNGKVYQWSESAISPDGKTETDHQWGTGRTSGKPVDVTLVYEKQE